MKLFLLVWFLRLCGTLGARGDGGGRSGQDGFSTLFNPAIPWIPNHTMNTKPYHVYRTITRIPNHTTDTKPNHSIVDHTVPFHTIQYSTQKLCTIPHFTLPNQTIPYHAMSYIVDFQLHQIPAVKLPQSYT